MSRSGKGGHPATPMPGGAVLLSSAPKPEPQVQLPPRTKRILELQNCDLALFAALDTEGKCVHYRAVIMDHWENVEYRFDFLDNVREYLETTISQMPLIGEVPPDGS